MNKYFYSNHPALTFFIFNFILLNLYFFDYFLILPFLVIFTFFWSFFIKNNFFSVRVNASSKDILTNSKFLKKIHYIFFLNWNFVNFLFFLLFFIFFKYDSNVFWFNHLKINNFLILLIIILIFISLALIFFIKFFKNSNINYNIDYFSSIFNLIIFIPLMFLSNSLYTFLFVLELNSLLILYKFSVSRNWFPKNNFSQKNTNSFTRLLPKSYLNMIFFQYWANFFSSMLLMFSIFNVIYIFGSSEWFFLNFINQTINYNFYFYNNFYFIFLWITFFIGFFLKIGFTPLHLFKIEVYKGIPFISIFFYTTLYFLSFFLFFIILVFYHLNTFKIYWNLIFLTFIILGLLYSLILLFDVNLLKSFFAYSTIVNVLTFIIILYININ